MIYLSLSILCSTLNHLLFRWFQQWRIRIFPAIVTNYLICAALGRLLAREATAPALPYERWIALALLQGGLLIGCFFMISATTRENGVGIAALSTRLSVVIPTVAAFLLYGDSLGPLKVIGILGALAALCLSSLDGTVHGRRSSGARRLPLLLFAAFGANMTLAKYVQAAYLDSLSYHIYLMWAFGFAFLTGGAVFTVRHLRGGVTWEGRDIGAGVLLGLNNYGAFYFLIRAVGQAGWESSVVFPTISVAVVVLSSGCGYLLFGEPATARRLTALAIGLGAIVLINI